MPAAAFSYLKDDISEQQHARRDFFVPQKEHLAGNGCTPVLERRRHFWGGPNPFVASAVVVISGGSKPLWEHRRRFSPGGGNHFSRFSVVVVIS